MNSEISDPGLAAIGKQFIMRARQDMPILKMLAEEYKGAFEKVHILCRLPVTAETAVFIQALRNCGTEILVVGSGITSTEDEVAAALAVEYDFEVHAIKNETQEVYRRHLDLGLESRPDIILDDGAIFTMRWAENWQGSDIFSRCWGITEETTSGLSVAREVYGPDDYPYPIINVNDTMTKSLVDNCYGTGQSVVMGMIDASGCLIRGANIVVIGYGHVGKSCAAYLHKMGAKVTVVEKDDFKALAAFLEGYDVLAMDEALPQADIVITATGVIAVLSDEELNLLKDGCCLANAGHDYLEIDMEALDRISIEKQKVSKYITMYRSKAHKFIYLLCHGGVVNLGVSSGNPPAVMDASFGINFLGVLYIVRNYDHLEKQIHPIPEMYDQKIAHLKLLSLQGRWSKTYESK